MPDSPTVENGQLDIRLGDRDYDSVSVEVAKYGDDTPAVWLQYFDSEYGPEKLATVSVNLGGSERYPAEGCIFVKSYAENEGLQEQLVEYGLIHLTGRVENTGWVTVSEAMPLGWLAAMITEMENAL